MAWLDFGKRKAAAPKPLDVTSTPARSRVSPQIGSSGLRQYGGVVAEEFLPELAGPLGMRVYREMGDNDAIVGAVLFTLTMLLRQTKWDVKAADDTPEADDAKTFLQSVIDDMDTPLSHVMDEATTMFQYGFAPMEVVMKVRNGSSGRAGADDGRIGVASISLRAQPTVNRWQIDPATDAIEGFFQQPFTGPEVFIPMDRLLLFRTTTARSNPEGRSILRSAYRAWYFKKKLEGIEAVGVERDLAGLPVVYIPSEYMSANASDQDKLMFQGFQQLVKNLRRDQSEGVVMPGDRDKDGHRIFELELLNSGSSRAFDTTKIIDRYNRAIATSVLADFIFLGQGATGSFALSSDKTELFITAIDGFQSDLAATLNRTLIPRLWKANGFDPATMPTLEPGEIQKRNIAELAAYITAIAGAGLPLFPDRDLENNLREAGGLPPAPEEGLMPQGAPGHDPQGAPGYDPNADAGQDGGSGQAGAQQPQAPQ